MRGTLAALVFVTAAVSLATAGDAQTPCKVKAGWSVYGQGWPGTRGTPIFTVDAPPALCKSFNFIVGNTYGQATSAVLVGGFQPTSQPTPWDGTLLVVPIFFQPLQVPPGIGRFPIQVPCRVALCGLRLYFQVAEVDPGASKGLSFTPGLQLILGG